MNDTRPLVLALCDGYVTERCQPILENVKPLREDV